MSLKHARMRCHGWRLPKSICDPSLLGTASSEFWLKQQKLNSDREDHFRSRKGHDVRKPSLAGILHGMEKGKSSRGKFRTWPTSAGEMAKLPFCRDLRGMSLNRKRIQLHNYVIISQIFRHFPDLVLFVQFADLPRCSSNVSRFYVPGLDDVPVWLEASLFFE